MTSVVNLVPKGSAGRCGKLQEDRKPVSEDFLTNIRPYFPLMVILSALPHIHLPYLMVGQIHEIMLKKLCNILLLGKTLYCYVCIYLQRYDMYVGNKSKSLLFVIYLLVNSFKDFCTLEYFILSHAFVYCIHTIYLYNVHLNRNIFFFTQVRSIWTWYRSSH